MFHFFIHMELNIFTYPRGILIIAESLYSSFITIDDLTNLKDDRIVS